MTHLQLKGFKDRIVTLERENAILRKLLKGLLENPPYSYSCDCFHHPIKAQHDCNEPCGPMNRWNEAIDAAYAFFDGKK